MALMRGTPYIFRTSGFQDGHEVSGYQIHVGDGSSFLTDDEMQELAVMVVGSLNEDEIREAVDRALEKHSGNFGVDPLRAALGLPTWMDWVKRQNEAL